MTDKPYIPVSCDFVDMIEILATRGSVVHMKVRQGDEINDYSGMLKTWFTKEKIEYLETQEGLVFRLDEVIEINGILNSHSCDI